MTAELQHSTRLAEVVIRSNDLANDIGVYAAITATGPEPLERNSTTPRASFVLGDGRVTLQHNDPNDGSTQRGIERLVIDVGDLSATADRLTAAGAKVERHNDDLFVDADWAGVLVELRQRLTDSAQPPRTGGATLDHVAILVTDVEVMASRWASILGSAADHVGLHPLGTGLAGRFSVGDRMIELLTPLPDSASPLRARLDRFGQGPFAIALIASDLEATTAAVSTVGARLIDQPPHIIVHPSDASGVPIQLTPRVHH